MNLSRRILLCLSIFSTAVFAAPGQIVDVQIQRYGNIEYHYGLFVEMDPATSGITQIGLIHYQADVGHWVFPPQYILSIGSLAHGGGGEIHPGVMMVGSLDSIMGGPVKLLKKGVDLIFDGQLKRDGQGFMLCTPEVSACRKLKAILIHRVGFTGLGTQIELKYE